MLAKILRYHMLPESLMHKDMHSKDMSLRTLDMDSLLYLKVQQSDVWISNDVATGRGGAASTAQVTRADLIATNGAEQRCESAELRN